MRKLFNSNKKFKFNLRKLIYWNRKSMKKSQKMQKKYKNCQFCKTICLKKLKKCQIKLKN